MSVRLGDFVPDCRAETTEGVIDFDDWQGTAWSDHKVKVSRTCLASTGRNLEEILRAPDSLQLTARHAVAKLADWTPGPDVILLPSVSGEEARTRFPGGFEAKTRYRRAIPRPRS